MSSWCGLQKTPLYSEKSPAIRRIFLVNNLVSFLWKSTSWSKMKAAINTSIFIWLTYSEQNIMFQIIAFEWWFYQQHIFMRLTSSSPVKSRFHQFFSLSLCLSTIFFDLLRGIWQQVDRVVFRRGQGGSEGRDDVRIDFPALKEAVWRHVQSARLLVWNVWRAKCVRLKCVCFTRVKIAVAVQVGVSVWHHSGLGYVHTGQTYQPCSQAHQPARRRAHGKQFRYRWQVQDTATCWRRLLVSPTSADITFYKRAKSTKYIKLAIQG